MRDMGAIDWIANILVIVGALNWGLAVFGTNAVEWLSFGWLINTVYVLVALSGLWVLYKLFK